MEKVLRALEHHMVQYLIVGFFGVFAAYLFFQIGGSLAEVTGQEKSLFGVSFKAGGGFGGFLLVFLLSAPVIARLRNLEGLDKQLRDDFAKKQRESSEHYQRAREQLTAMEGQLRSDLALRERTFREDLEGRFDPANDPITVKLYFRSTPKLPKSQAYKCVCTLYNEDTGTKTTVEAEPYWEAGVLAVTVKAVGRDDYLEVRVEGGGKVWSCDRFHASERRVDIKRRLLEGAGP